MGFRLHTKRRLTHGEGSRPALTQEGTVGLYLSNTRHLQSPATAGAATPRPWERVRRAPEGRHNLAQRGSAGMASQNEVPASPGRGGISQPDLCKRTMDAAPDGAE
jgi:hypothetical protein